MGSRLLLMILTSVTIFLFIAPSSEGFFFPQFLRRFSASSRDQQNASPESQYAQQASVRILGKGQGHRQQQLGSNQVIIQKQPSNFHVPKELCIACENFPWHPVNGPEKPQTPGGPGQPGGDKPSTTAQKPPPELQQQPTAQASENQQITDPKLLQQHRDVTVIVNALGQIHGQENKNRQPYSINFSSPQQVTEYGQSQGHVQVQPQQQKNNEVNVGAANNQNQVVSLVNNDLNQNQQQHQVKIVNNQNQNQNGYSSGSGNDFRSPQFSQPPPNPGFNEGYNPFIMGPPPPRSQQQQQQRQQYQRPSILQPVKQQQQQTPQQQGYSSMNINMVPPPPPPPPVQQQQQQQQSYSAPPVQQQQQQQQQSYSAPPVQQQQQQQQQSYSAPQTSVARPPQKYNFKLIRPSGFSVVHSKNPRPFQLPPLTVGSIVATHQAHSPNAPGGYTELQPAKLVYQEHLQNPGGFFRGNNVQQQQSQIQGNKVKYNGPPPAGVKFPPNFGAMTINQIPIEQVPKFVTQQSQAFRPFGQPPRGNYGFQQQKPQQVPQFQQKPYGPPSKLKPHFNQQQLIEGSFKRPQQQQFQQQQQQQYQQQQSGYGPPGPSFDIRGARPFNPVQQINQNQGFSVQGQQTKSSEGSSGQEQFAENRPSTVHFIQQNGVSGTIGYASNADPNKVKISQQQQQQQEPEIQIQISNSPPKSQQFSIPYLLQLHQSTSDEEGQLSKNVYQYEQEQSEHIVTKNNSSESTEDSEYGQKIQPTEQSKPSTTSTLVTTTAKINFVPIPVPSTSAFSYSEEYHHSTSGGDSTKNTELISKPSNINDFIKNPHLQSIDQLEPEPPLHSYVKNGDFEIIPATQYDITHLFNRPTGTGQNLQSFSQIQPQQQVQQQDQQHQFNSQITQINTNGHRTPTHLPLPVPISSQGGISNSPPLYIVSGGSIQQQFQSQQQQQQQPQQQARKPVEVQNSNQISEDHKQQQPKPFSFISLGSHGTGPSGQFSQNQQHFYQNQQPAFPQHFDPLPPSIVSALLHSTKTSSLTHSHFADKTPEISRDRGQRGQNSGESATIYINSIPVPQASQHFIPSSPSSPISSSSDTVISASSTTVDQKVNNEESNDLTQVNCSHQKWAVPYNQQQQQQQQQTQESKQQIVQNNDDQYVLQYVPSTAPQSSVYWVEQPGDSTTAIPIGDGPSTSFVYSIVSPTAEAENALQQHTKNLNQGQQQGEPSNTIQFSRQIFGWSPKIVDFNVNVLDNKNEVQQPQQSVRQSFSSSSTGGSAPFDVIRVNGDSNTQKLESSNFRASSPVKVSPTDSRPFSSKFIRYPSFSSTTNGLGSSGSSSSAKQNFLSNDFNFDHFVFNRIKSPTKIVEQQEQQQSTHKNCTETHSASESRETVQTSSIASNSVEEVELITAPPTTFSPSRIKTKGRDKIRFKVGARFPAGRPSVFSTTTTTTAKSTSSEDNFDRFVENSASASAAISVPIYRAQSLAPIFKAPANHGSLEDIYKKSEIRQEISSSSSSTEQTSHSSSLVSLGESTTDESAGVTTTSTSNLNEISNDDVEEKMTSRKIQGSSSNQVIEISNSSSTSEEIIPTPPSSDMSTSTKVIKTVRVRQRMRPGVNGGVSSFFGSKSVNGGSGSSSSLRGRPSRVRVVQRPVSQDYISNFPEFAAPEGDSLGREEEQALKDALIEIKKI